jgi:hypothetical protein
MLMARCFDWFDAAAVRLQFVPAAPASWPALAIATDGRRAARALRFVAIPVPVFGFSHRL